MSRSITVGPPARTKISSYSKVGGLTSSNPALLEHRERRPLERAPPPHRLTGEVEGAGRHERNRRAWQLAAHRSALPSSVGFDRPTTRTRSTRRPAIDRISKSNPPTCTRSPGLGRRPSWPKSSPPTVV